ncbi:HET-domain-containing protein, partial [Lizonia empirigonia]
PTRAIDVGSRQRDPKLHEPTPGDRGRFCALSYCWGRSVPFVTSLSTYEDRKKGFSIELLPQTIKHAILLVRELGISYLWVDSLCIIQDSVSDWEREAARMCDIYSHAVLYNCCYGESVFARGNVHNTVTNTDHFTIIQELKLDALHERGWCLQEVTLAPRKVWFKSGEMSWSCTRSAACDCRPELESIDSIEEDDNMYLLHGIAYHEYNQASRSQWLTLWDVLLDQYFLRQLSDVRDRLPAIAGLAAVVHKHTNTRYLFGLWESEKFLDQLLWHHSGSSGRTPISDPRKCPPSDYAPSWSWAS